MLARFTPVPVLVLALVGACWSGRSTSGPPRWRHAAVPEILPKGAWLIAAFDVELDSPSQLEKEAKARRDPAAVRNGSDGCQFPTTHVAVGVYDRDQILAASRGGYHRGALLRCVADIGRARQGTSVTEQTVAGLDVLEVRSSEGSFLFAATDSGMIVGASSRSLIARAVTDDGALATSDPALGPLIRDARARGELWIAALVPRGSPAVDRVLAALGGLPAGRVVSLVGAVRLRAPQRIDLLITVERAADAGRLATALEGRRLAVRAIADPDLLPLLDAVRVVHDGPRVRIVGEPTGLDWWKTFLGLTRTIPRLAP